MECVVNGGMGVRRHGRSDGAAVVVTTHVFSLPSSAHDDLPHQPKPITAAPSLLF
jgi:hypothetical protein